MRHPEVLALLLLAGCSPSFSQANLKPADAAQTTAAPDPSVKPKVKQWFTTDTPETLPKEKLDKMSLGGGGFGGY